MTVSNDVTVPGPVGPADGDQQQAPGSIPALADCFTPRPHAGPGPLAEIPRDECLVLTGSARAVGAAAGMPGGTGKTQLAVHLARTWQQENPDGLLLWLEAASRDSILSGYLRAAAAAAAAGAAAEAPAVAATDSAEAVAARFIAALAETATPWLLGLDGLTDPADAEGLWPLAGESGRVLVTVRDGVTVPESLRSPTPA